MSGKGKSYIAENRELAFKVWREQGQNIEGTLRALKSQHGLSISKPTLYDWIEKFSWKDRAARADEISEKAKDATEEDAILAALLDRKKHYDGYFETWGKNFVDNQATYAYASLLKSIAAVQRQGSSFDRPRVFLENLQWTIKWLSEHDPEGLKMLARNLDSMTEAFKAECINA